MGILNYTADQTRDWMTGKTDAQVAEQAASMGLNRGQIREAYGTIGKNYTDADLDGYAKNNGYTFGANGALSKDQLASSVASQPAQNTGGMQIGNQYVSKAELQKFFAEGGDPNEWAQRNGITNPDQIHQLATQARGIAGNAPTGDAALQQYFKQYQRYNPTGKFANDFAGWVNDQGANTANSIRSGTYTGAATSPSDFAPGGIHYGKSFSYQDSGQGALGMGGGWGDGSTTGGAGGAQPPAGGGNTSPGGPVSGGGGSSGGSSSSAGGSSAPGNWQVTPDQTVESRVAGILAAGNPLVEQRRAQSDMKMNARGLVNSSIAQTASDDAAYSAALDIAKPDAATFADAAKTNAMAKTTWGISQNNNQTSRDNTQAQIGAQRELQRATQLYNNLTNQTATATSLQQWGLNTVASIQASDLSAEAKSAAIGTIQQYLADSYQIQGDWHTTAARMIDSIFD